MTHSPGPGARHKSADPKVSYIDFGGSEATRVVTRKRILLIEDATDIAELVALHLRDQGFSVTHTADGASGLERAAAGGWDLVILDLTLPNVDGLEICKQLRANGDATPLMIVSARSTELDRVLGLELGADDYVVKPFGVMELVARAKALFRRAGAALAQEERGDTLRAGALTVDTSRRGVRLGERDIELTPREFDLLEAFMRAPGRVFRRAELLDRVWGHGFDGYEHTVNTHINRLRAKIEPDPANPAYIVTVWGVGYKLGAAA